MMNKLQLMKNFQKNWKEHWNLKILKDLNFERQNCKNCGKFFWAQQKQEICNDASCRDYEFIGEGLKKKFDYFSAQKLIKDFFTKNKHAFVERYPVLCRWFPNLYFTIAGVVNFYRMSNSNFIFEMPANPAIMFQPCLRFVDIPNIGVTGRHFSCHTHVEQASLVNEGGYWKEKAIELDFELLTKIFGIDSNDINFIEDVWVGPGAFGSSLEYHVKGLELGNCVFTEAGDQKLIDMGAGLERFVWLSHGSETVYDAVFGDVIEKMKSKAGVSYDKELFGKYSRLAGKLNFDEINNIDKEKEKIAEYLGISLKELQEKIEPMQAIYAIADHMRALQIAIADGGLPSNIAGGYNLRVLLRRSLMLLNKHNFDFDLYCVNKLLSDFFKPEFPELLRKKDFIEDVLKVEEEKYKETIKTASKLLESLKEEKLTRAKIIELYDSHGISPELLKDRGIIKEIPSEFYSNVTEKHMQSKKEIGKQIIDVSGLKQTGKLYYADQSRGKFKAIVLKVDGEKIILDQTAFYPRSGGQEPDLGKINGRDVYDIETIDGVIVHFVKGKFKKGQMADCEVDLERRKIITRHHTCVHIINGACQKVLGPHIWQAGSKKDIDKAHLDITHHKPILDEEKIKIEKLANELINKEIKINKVILPRIEAEKKYGFRIYQGGVVPLKELRILDIPDGRGVWDVEACGGLHLDNTHEGEEIFIISTKKIQDGIIRIEFVAGKKLAEKTAGILTERQTELKESYERKRQEYEEKKKVIKFSRKMKGNYSNGIYWLDTENMKQLEVVAHSSVKSEKDYSILVGKGCVFGIKGKKCRTDIKKIVLEIAKAMGGSGGGTEFDVHGGGPLKEKSREAFEKGKKMI